MFIRMICLYDISSARSEGVHKAGTYCITFLWLFGVTFDCDAVTHPSKAQLVLIAAIWCTTCDLSLKQPLLSNKLPSDGRCMCSSWEEKEGSCAHANASTPAHLSKDIGQAWCAGRSMQLESVKK